MCIFEGNKREHALLIHLLQGVIRLVTLVISLALCKNEKSVRLGVRDCWVGLSIRRELPLKNHLEIAALKIM